MFDPLGRYEQAMSDNPMLASTMMQTPFQTTKPMPLLLPQDPPPRCLSGTVFRSCTPGSLNRSRLLDLPHELQSLILGYLLAGVQLHVNTLKLHSTALISNFLTDNSPASGVQAASSTGLNSSLTTEETSITDSSKRPTLARCLHLSGCGEESRSKTSHHIEMHWYPWSAYHVSPSENRKAASSGLGPLAILRASKALYVAGMEILCKTGSLTFANAGDVMAFQRYCSSVQPCLGPKNLTSTIDYVDQEQWQGQWEGLAESGLQCSEMTARVDMTAWIGDRGWQIDTCISDRWTETEQKALKMVRQCVDQGLSKKVNIRFVLGTSRCIERVVK